MTNKVFLPQHRLAKSSGLSQAEYMVFFAPLILGSIIYLLWRPRTLLVFRLVKRLGLMPVLMKLRIASLPLFHALPKILIYSVPNGLWAFAFVYGVLIAWKDHMRERAAWLWLSFAILLVEGSEVGQSVGLVPGTFDWNDLVANNLGIASALATLYRIKRI